MSYSLRGPEWNLQPYTQIRLLTCEFSWRVKSKNLKVDVDCPFFVKSRYCEYSFMKKDMVQYNEARWLAHLLEYNTSRALWRSRPEKSSGWLFIRGMEGSARHHMLAISIRRGHVIQHVLQTKKSDWWEGDNSYRNYHRFIHILGKLNFLNKGIAQKHRSTVG